MESSVSWSVPATALQALQRSFAPQARSAPRVMLLTSSLGAGHTRAASAIERGILQQAPQCATETVDFWSLLHPAVGDAVKRSYLRLVTDRPQLYQRIYQLDQHFWRRILERGETPPAVLHELYRLIEQPAGPLTGLHHWLDRTMCRQLMAILAPAPVPEGNLKRRWHQQMIAMAWGALARRLQRRIHRFAPDVIIATQVNMGALAADLKRRGKCDARLLGVPTDFGVHDFWAQKEIDVLCIADRSLLPEAEVELPRAARVEVTGLPLMPEFCNPVDPTVARRQLGIPLDRPMVLVLGGGLGLGMSHVIRRLAVSLAARADAPVVVVLAGNNEGIRQQLQGETVTAAALASGRLRIQGWTEQVGMFMRAAELIVGKPGGLTTAEALASGRPLLSTSCLGGQEAFNVRHLERNGVGGLLSTEALCRKVAALLDDKPALRRVQEKAWKLGKRGGANLVAARVLESAHGRHARVRSHA